MSTVNTAAGVLGGIPAVIQANTDALTQTAAALTALQAENTKLIADVQAALAAATAGQPSQPQIDAAAASLANLATNNANLGALATQIQAVTASQATEDQTLTGTTPTAPSA